MTRRSVIAAILSFPVMQIAWAFPLEEKPAGVLGETYFNVKLKPMFPVGKRLYLDGADITNLASECDLVQGWVMVYPRVHRRDTAQQKVCGTLTIH